MNMANLALSVGLILLACLCADAQSLPKLTPRQLAVNQLVNASRILALQGVADDTIGHFSIRDPLSPSTAFLITGGTSAPAQVTPADIAVARINDSVVISAALTEHATPIRPAEIFIHSSVYARFPNTTVNSIAYYRAEQLLPWSLFASDNTNVSSSQITAADLTRFFATTSATAFMGPHPAPVFNTFDEDPQTTTISVDNAIKAFSLAAKFGPSGATVASVNETDGFRPLVLMRHDGATVVGTTVPEVTYRFVQAVQSARIQYHASQFSMENGTMPQFVPAQATRTSDDYLRSWLRWMYQVENSIIADSTRSPELWTGSGIAPASDAGGKNSAAISQALPEAAAVVVSCVSVLAATLLSL